MDQLTLTKLAGILLSSLLVVFGTRAYLQVRAEHPLAQGVGYALPSAQQASATGGTGASGHGAGGAAAPGAAAAPAAAFDAGAILAMIGKANAGNGKDVFKKCVACHTTDKGAPNKVGPNLWGVVGRKKGGLDGFGYSEPMKAKGGEWTHADLAAFLNNPKGYLPNTKMVFAGIANPAELADLMAYLHQLSDSPAPMPQ